jgi:hypothetical protein
MPAATVECLSARPHPHRYREDHAPEGDVPLAQGPSAGQGQGTRLHAQGWRKEGGQQDARRTWAVGAVPVLGTVPMAIRQVYRAATKENRGQQRSAMAYELAVHLITHNCALAQGIVSELYSYEKMLWMLDQDTDMLTPLLMTKLAST